MDTQLTSSAFKMVNLITSQNIYFCTNPEARTYTGEIYNYEAATGSAFHQIKLDAARNLTFAGKRIQPNQMTAKLIELIGEEKAESVAQAYSQDFSQQIRYPIEMMLGLIGLNSVLKLNFLFSDLFITESKQIYFITCASEFNVYELEGGMAPDNPSYRIPGAVLYVYAYNEEDQRFHLKDPLVSNDLLKDIFEGEDVSKHISELKQKQQSSTRKEKDTSKKEKDRSAKSLLQEVHDHLGPQLKIALKKSIEDLKKFLIEKGCEKTEINKIFEELEADLNLLEDEELLEKSIKKSCSALQKQVKNRNLDERDQKIFQYHLKEFLIQTTQPMFNLLIKNLKAYQTEIKEENQSKQMNDLIKKLETDRNEFYKYAPSSRANHKVQQFFNQVHKDITKTAQAITLPEKTWAPILKTIVLSLTVFGLLLTLPKAIYGIATNTSPFWFQTKEAAKLQETNKCMFNVLNQAQLSCAA